MCGEPGEAQNDLGQSHIVCDQLCCGQMWGKHEPQWQTGRPSESKHGGQEN